MLQQQGAFCIVTNGLADGLNRGKRMRGRGGGGSDYPSLLAKAQKDEQEGKGPKRRGIKTMPLLTI